jgi:hypothetical protein
MDVFKGMMSFTSRKEPIDKRGFSYITRKIDESEINRRKYNLQITKLPTGIKNELLTKLEQNALSLNIKYTDLLRAFSESEGAMKTEHINIINMVLDSLEKQENILLKLLDDLTDKKLQDYDYKLKLTNISDYEKREELKNKYISTPELAELEDRYFYLYRLQWLHYCYMRLSENIEKRKGEGISTSNIEAILKEVLLKIRGLKNIGVEGTYNLVKESKKEGTLFITTLNKVLMYFNIKDDDKTGEIKGELKKTFLGGGGAKTVAKKTIKKIVCGKLRCIYKIPGSRKEHLKYKGQLITVAKYKELMKH